MIRAVNLVKFYPSDAGPVKALEDLNLEIPSGGFISIMGPSGCGKSTLLNLMAGLDRSDAGSLLVNGADLSRLNDSQLTDYRRRVVGVVFQFYNLLPTLSVFENITLPALLSGMPERTASERAYDLAAQVGLSHRLGHRPHQLSGGEMQRASIARALVNDPAILLADEPTGNLDTRNARQILELLRNLHEQRQVTIVMVTHSAEASAASDSVIRMLDGKVEGRQ